MTWTLSNLKSLWYHICYLDEIFGEEKQSACWKFAFWEAHKFSHQITMFSFKTLDQLLFISHFVFRRRPGKFFFSKNIRQMEAGQNNKYNITNTSDLVQVWLLLTAVLKVCFHVLAFVQNVFVASPFSKNCSNGNKSSDGN